jgi:hypothetical protein
VHNGGSKYGTINFFVYQGFKWKQAGWSPTGTDIIDEFEETIATEKWQNIL